MIIQVNVEIGYAPLASELVIEARVSDGISPYADTEMLADDGATNSPCWFCILA